MIQLLENFKLYRTVEDDIEIWDNLILVNSNIKWSIQNLSEKSSYFDFNTKKYKLYVENFIENYFLINDILEDKKWIKYKVENEEFIKWFFTNTSEIILTKIEKC